MNTYIHSNNTEVPSVFSLVIARYFNTQHKTGHHNTCVAMTSRVETG